MLEINTETMMIALTRGDSASIVFGAVTPDGNPWQPSQGDETLTLAVAKKWGGEVLMKCENAYDGNPYTEVVVDETTFDADKAKYWYVDDDEYVQCTELSVYDPTETYYVKDWASFWTINITADKWLNDDGSDKFKFADYVYDVQVGTSTGADTIIGKTDDLSPTFRVLGEVAEE